MAKRLIGFALAARMMGAAALVLAAAANAQTVVPFDGTVTASCILTLSKTGTLAMNTGGTELGSEQIGGASAVLGVAATGGAPTVLFTAPTMSVSPSGYAGTPTVSMKYSSVGGASQAYTSGASQYKSANPLADTVTIDAKAVDSSGFVAGTYRVQTTATCQQ